MKTPTKAQQRATKRRGRIIHRLMHSSRGQSTTALALEMDASRGTIQKDIKALKAGGHPILDFIEEGVKIFYFRRKRCTRPGCKTRVSLPIHQLCRYHSHLEHYPFNL